MGKSSPDAPDYEAAAEATAEGNRVDQDTPFGNVRWTQDPTTGQWKQTTSLNPQSQEALDAQLGLTTDRSTFGRDIFGRVASEMGQAPDYSNFQDYGGVPDAGGARDRAEEALYGRSTSRLDPQWEQAGSDLEAKLVAQGLRPGMPAWEREMENFARDKTDAYEGAREGAIIGGGQEASRDFGLNKEQAIYQNQLRQQQIAETMQQRGFSLNEINALLSGQQVGMPQMPGYNAGPDYLSAANQEYQGDLDRYSTQQAGYQGLMSGAFGLGSAYLMGPG